VCKIIGPVFFKETNSYHYIQVLLAPFFNKSPNKKDYFTQHAMAYTAIFSMAALQKDFGK
jgi:hypothetical protein